MTVNLSGQQPKLDRGEPSRYTNKHRLTITSYVFSMSLVQVIQRLSLARDLATVQEIVRNAARDLTGADGATFILRENDQCHYADEDAIGPLWKGMRFPVSACISGWSMLHRKAAVIPDIYADPRVPADAYRPTFVKSLAVVPIRSLDPIGAIGNYWATRHEATEEEVLTLQALADTTAVALENVRICKELDQRVRERTRELKRVNDELQQHTEEADRSNHAKGRFLATASHDLRQPLQTISLLNGTLRRLAGDADAAYAAEQQQQAIASMSRLLNTLLDISKLDAGAITPQIGDFELGGLFDELRVEFTDIAAKKGLELEVAACRECARSDRTLLGQILRNLLTNAIRYTHSGAVRLQCEREAAGLRIDVRDTGIGISHEHLPHIFEEFYQVGASRTAVRDGHGLGLSIVQRVARLLGHEIKVRSQLCQGSVFSVLLPRGVSDQPAQHPAKSLRASAPSARERHILVVEDDPAVLNATRLLLKLSGYSVTTAASLGEALRIARESEDIDLLVTDLHLGAGGLGTEVIKSVRDVLRRPINAVLVTGDTSGGIREIVTDDRTHVTKKPIDPDNLLGLIGELIEE